MAAAYVHGPGTILKLKTISHHLLPNDEYEPGCHEVQDF